MLFFSSLIGPCFEIEPETTMTLFREINVTIRSYQIFGTRNVVTHTDMARLSLLCWATGIILPRKTCCCSPTSDLPTSSVAASSEQKFEERTAAGLEAFSVPQYDKQSFASGVVISSPDRYWTCVSFMYKYQVQELASEDSD
jgi:hypothetical protein